MRIHDDRGGTDGLEFFDAGEQLGAQRMLDANVDA